MKKCGIYEIYNAASGKRYIGQSNDLLHRRWFHFNRLARGIHHNSHLQAAYNKYGADVFEFRVLEEAEVSALTEREHFWILEYNTIAPAFGYNLCLETRERREFSSDTLKRMSEAHIGIRHTSEARAKMSATRKGRKQSPEHIAARISARKSYAVSGATRKKISASLKHHFKTRGEAL